MIANLSLWQWIKFTAAVLLFLSPGLLWTSSRANRQRLPLASRLTLSFGLSLGAWIILLIWLQWLGLSLTASLVRPLFGATALLAALQLVRRRQEILPWLQRRESLAEIAAAALCLLIGLFYLYLFRHLLSGMGSDSMHHTLITDLLLAHGQIPQDYGPYAPAITFSYHFGYHALAAALSWLSGIAPRLTLILSGPLLLSLISLAGAGLSSYFAKNNLAGLLGAAIPGLIYIFPAYSLLWGRYSQLLGTLLLMVFLQALIVWEQQDSFAPRFIPPLAVLTAAYLFSHYRIFIAGGLFAVLYLALRKDWLAALHQYFLRWLGVPLGAFLLSAPWLVQLYLSRQQGFSAAPAPAQAAFYSLDRLGPHFQSETQTWLLIGLSLLGLLLALLRRQRLALALSVWLLLLSLLSQPNFLGVFMDPVTLVISSYTPIVISLSLLLESLLAWLSRLKAPLSSQLRIALSSAVGLALIAGLLSGAVRWRSIDLQANSFLTPADLKAAAWLRAHTPAEARFMINTYQFPITANLIIGLDGGYWLPVLAQRRTLIPPMVYSIEKLNAPGADQLPLQAHRLNGELTSPPALAWLQQQDVQYVYLGAQGEPIPPASLLASSAYALVYEQDGVHVFRLVH